MTGFAVVRTAGEPQDAVLQIVVVIRVVVVLGLVSGCGDECPRDASECLDGASYRVCDSVRDGHAVSYEWMTRTCFASNPHCVTRELFDGSEGAYCALRTERDPACEGVTFGFCRDGVEYGCSDGFINYRETCTMGCDADALLCAQ